jgi:hypothetical protein
MATSTFHPFPRLPLELQCQIWTLILPVPSLLSPQPGSPSPDNPAVILSTIAQIHHCSLPLIVPVNIHFSSFTSTTMKETIYLRPKSDILFLKSPTCRGKLDIDNILADPVNQRNVKRVAFEWPCLSADLRAGEKEGKGMGRIIGGLRGLERVFVVHGYSPEIVDFEELEERFLESLDVEVGRNVPKVEFVQDWLVGRKEIREWRREGMRLRGLRKLVLG